MTLTDNARPAPSDSVAVRICKSVHAYEWATDLATRRRHPCVDCLAAAEVAIQAGAR